MKKLCLILISISLTLVLAGCNKVSQRSYDLVKPGMGYTEVVTLLGSPDEKTSIKIGDLSGKSATWKSKEGSIVIQFLDDKVRLKNFNSNGKHKVQLN